MASKGIDQDELKQDVDKAGEPDYRKRLQFTSLDNNNNKYWIVEFWSALGIAKRSWGRVGGRGEIMYERTTQAHLEKLAKAKVKDGYQPVDLHKPKVAVVAQPNTTPASVVFQNGPGALKTDQVVGWIYKEAGEAIQAFLNVPVDALSAQQINQGRQLLKLAQAQHSTVRNGYRAAQTLLAQTVESYYKAIPTKLPAKIKKDEIIQEFCNDFHEQETRLDQLEAGLASVTAQTSGVTQVNALGADLVWIDQSSQEAQRVIQYILTTMAHGYRVNVRDVFAVVVPHERARFEGSQRGKTNVKQLFHGTRSANVRHILRSGFRRPSSAANGWMFGPGIYFADKASKSANYCSSRYGVPQFLFVSDVALGNQFIAKGAYNYTTPPAGHDSVWGKEGHTGSYGSYLYHNEFIIYTEEQVTIRYLVTFDK